MTCRHTKRVDVKAIDFLPLACLLTVLTVVPTLSVAAHAQEVQVIASPGLEAQTRGLPFLKLRLPNTLDSEKARVGQRVSLEVVDAVERDGQTVITAGAHAEGVVNVAKRAGRNQVQGQLVLTATEVDQVNGKRLLLPPLFNLRGVRQPVSPFGRCTYPKPDAILSLFRRGDDVTILQGTELTAPLPLDRP